MEAKAIWKGKRGFIGETESGHQVKMDIAIEKGGENTGPPPIQILLVALGGCTGIDLVSIMENPPAVGTDTAKLLAAVSFLNIEAARPRL